MNITHEPVGVPDDLPPKPELPEHQRLAGLQRSGRMQPAEALLRTLDQLGYAICRVGQGVAHPISADARQELLQRAFGIDPEILQREEAAINAWLREVHERTHGTKLDPQAPFVGGQQEGQGL